MRVLVIGAHPDDAEYYCGGTICRCVERGDDVSIAVVTDGGCGSDNISREEASALRRREAEEASAVAGAKLIWVGLPDAHLFYTEENRLKIVEAVRESAPELMLIHGPNDYHPDHVSASRMAFDAAFLSTLSAIKTQHPPLAKCPSIYHMEHCCGIGFNPESYVDITSVYETKKKMLQCHSSQQAWLGDQFGSALIDDMEVISRFRGLQCNVKYAEGFIQVRDFPRANTTRLLP